MEFPAGIDAIRLHRLALREKVCIAPGPLFSPVRKFENFIRLRCGHGWSPRLESAVKTLGQLAREMLAKGA